MACRRSSLYAWLTLKGSSVVLVGWSIIEPGMYLIAACAIALRPLSRHFIFEWLKKRVYSSAGRLSKHGVHADRKDIFLNGLPASNSHSGFAKIQAQDDKSMTSETGLAHGITQTVRYDIEFGSAATRAH